jgi:hypothetical protein
MSNSRTVLPAPKLLNLIGIRSDANVITLAARTSSRLEQFANRAVPCEDVAHGDLLEGPKDQGR